MVSEDNLDFLRQRRARYIVGMPKAQLRQFEAQLLEQTDWTEVQPGVALKLVEHPDCGGGEQYVLCRSADRQQKEAAILEQQQQQRLMAPLERTDGSLCLRPVRAPSRIERRIGRWLSRYPEAEKLINVIVERDEKGHACSLVITEKAERQSWAQMAHGTYLLRTNCWVPPRPTPPLRCGAAFGRLSRSARLQRERPRAVVALVYPSDPGRGLLENH